MTQLIAAVLAIISLAATCCAGPEKWDDRFGVVASDTSGWGGPVTPMQGPRFFEPLRASWWYAYSYSDISAKRWPGYHRLFMFWRANPSTPDKTLQQLARDAKAQCPGETVWFAMSNEPNDRGQAKQTPQEFAAIYYKHHKNLKIGDPTCKILPPGLLDWTFHSTSCWKTGKAWYEEFRQAWTSDETCRNYSMQNYGTPYPPFDAFSLHTYDLRGLQGTPYAPQDWRYCRDQLLACYKDLQTYPEAAGKKIWNTEFNGLRGPSMTESAGLSAALVLWMRKQPFVERWFLFTMRDDKYYINPNTNIMNDDGTLSPMGKAHRDLSLLGPGKLFYHVPFHAEHGSGTAYTRPGCASTTDIAEDTSMSLKFYLAKGNSYRRKVMRGHTYKPPAGKIKKITFNYTTDYDNNLIYLAMDAPGMINKWKLDKSGRQIGYAEVDFAGKPADSVSFALVPKRNFEFSFDTGSWQASISNLTFYLAPRW